MFVSFINVFPRICEVCYELASGFSSLYFVGPLVAVLSFLVGSTGWGWNTLGLEAGFSKLVHRAWEGIFLVTVSTVFVWFYRFHRVCPFPGGSSVFIWFYRFSLFLGVSACFGRLTFVHLRHLCFRLYALLRQCRVVQFLCRFCVTSDRGFVLTACWQLNASKSGRSVRCTAFSR